MRALQNLFLVIGATVFGFGSGGLGLHYVMATVFTEPRGENWGGAIIWMVLIVGGGVVGALVGFTAAVRRVTQSKRPTWSPVEWAGVALGLTLGVLLVFRPYSFTGFGMWFWTALLVPVCAAAGRFLAKAIVSRVTKSR